MPGMPPPGSGSVHEQQQRARSGHRPASRPVPVFGRRAPTPPGVNPHSQLERAASGNHSVRAMQAFLRKQGYDIAADGVLGPETKSALQDWHKGRGQRNPAQWNNSRQRASILSREPHPRTSAGPFDKSPAPTASRGAPAPKHKDPAGMSGLGSLSGNPDVGALIPGSAANFGQEMNPKDAEALAGLEFDPQIHELAVEQAKQPRQAAQDQADIKNWYGQVLGSEKTAAGRDSAINQAAQASVGDATSGILASLGGAANAGSGLVGAAGADARGTLAALGSAQDQYNQDIQPLLANERAGVSAQEMARQSQLAQDLAAKIAEARGQKGQSVVQHRMDITQANNALDESRANAGIGIRQANNALLQQRFNNRLGLQQAAIAAQVSGVNAAAKMIAAGAKRRGAGIKTSDLASASGDAYTSNRQARAQGMGVKQIVQRVNDSYRAIGLSPRNPQVARAAMAVLRRLGITPDPRWYGLG